MAGGFSTLRAAALMTNDFNSGSKAHIKEMLLHSGDTVSFPVTASGTEPLKVTLCWSDPPHSGMSTLDATNSMLVNDLDLRVIGGGGYFIRRPWVLDPQSPDQAPTWADNWRDNVEQCVIDNPATGVFVVEVTHKGNLVTYAGGPPTHQRLSLIISGNVAQPAPGLRIQSIVQTGPNEVTLSWPAVPGQWYQVQHLDAVTASNWTMDQEISATKTNVAAAVTWPSQQTQRFYRVIKVN
jgi:hypothetical protein